MVKRKSLTTNGFTIIELMIATLVFSFILLLCATALIQISRLYQKGVVRAQTQETARSVIVNIAESIQFSSGDVYPAILNNGSAGYCIEDKLLSYLKDFKLVDTVPAAGETRYALIIKKEPGCSQSTPAQDLRLTSGISGDELLSPQMRVMDLTICKPGECGIPATSKLYRITVKIGYGDADLFDSGNCISSRLGGSFCATSQLTTTVQKRILE